MSGRVIPFAIPPSSPLTLVPETKRDPETPAPITPLPVLAHPPHAWEVSVVSHLAVATEPVRATTVVQMAIRVEPEYGRWEIAITREGFDYPTVLRGGYAPPETPMQAERTRAQVKLLNETLAACFGIPA